MIRAFAALACAGALLVAACADEERVERPKHLLVVTVDTLRADHLSLYGYVRGTSDREHATQRGSLAGFTIDELARDGVVFERAIAARGETFPSISTLFTGRTPLENCVVANRDVLPQSAHTLAERLAERGFRTAAFTTNKLLVPQSGIEQGFHTFYGAFGEHRDANVLGSARKWISEQDLVDGPPLFVWVHLMGPHLPYEPPPVPTADGVDFARLYVDPSYVGGANGSRAFVDTAYKEGRALSAADVERVVAAYDGEIARIDHLVSHFLAFCSGEDAEQPVDLLARSLLVFTADHGEELHQRNRYWAHSKSVYDSVLHVPLVLRHPASIASGRVSDTVAIEDVLPTALELLGVPGSTSVHGRSLVARLDGSTRASEERLAFSLWRDKIFTVCDGRWRLVWNPDGIEPDEEPPGAYPIPRIALFDRNADPQELTDVSVAHPEVVARLRGEIERWRAALKPCGAAPEPVSAERMKALQDLGYAGEQDEAERDGKR
ncbi:MAG: sulfatase-like hydrolase/transferase [Planctomycetota bacterium]